MARMARFAQLTLSVNQQLINETQAVLTDRLDGYGATDILFASSDGFLSVSFVVHGAHATDTGIAALQQNLIRALRDFRPQEVMMTSEPEVEETATA